MIWVVILLSLAVIVLLAVSVKLCYVINGPSVSGVCSLIDPVNQIHISQHYCGHKKYLKLSRGNEQVKYNLAVDGERSCGKILTVPELSCCLILDSMYDFKVIRLDLPSTDEPLAKIKATKLLSEDQIKMPVIDYIRQIQGREPDETEMKMLAESGMKMAVRYHICEILSISTDGQELWVRASTPQFGLERIYEGGDLRFCTSHNYGCYYCNLKDLTLRPAPEPDAEKDDFSARMS